MEQGRALELGQLIDVVAELGRDPERDLGHARGVPGGEGRLGVDNVRESERDAVQGPRAGQQRGAAGFLLAHGAPQTLLVEGGETGEPLREALTGLDQDGIEPRFDLGLHHPQRRPRPVHHGEHLEGLGERDDAGEQRDLAAADAVRATRAVEALVDRPYRLRHREAEPEASDDLGPAGRAGLDQLDRDLGPHTRDGGDASRAIDPRDAAGRLAQPEARRLEVLVPLDRPALTGRHGGVAAEQLEDTGRVARAAHILEQRGVVEVAPVGEREPQPVGELHTDQAGAQRVPHRLPVGEIEREGERAEDLGHADGLRRRGMGRRGMNHEASIGPWC